MSITCIIKQTRQKPIIPALKLRTTGKIRRAGEGRRDGRGLSPVQVDNLKVGRARQDYYHEKEATKDFVSIETRRKGRKQR